MDTKSLLEQFLIPDNGRARSISPLGGGYINNTFLVKVEGSHQDFILQRVSRRVFRNDKAIMSNLRVITDHCAAKIKDARWKVSSIVRTKDGADFACDGEGNIWRLMTRIMGATSYAAAQSLDHASECGKTLGHFLSLVSDIDQAKIQDPIPGFHNTPMYLERYDATIGDESAQRFISGNREAVRAMGFVEERRDFAYLFADAEKVGALKRRMFHGDPRINNIMVDDLTGRGTAMIDLDTCSIGLIQMDVGDAVRSICNPSGEDAASLSEVTFREDFFRAFMQGFLSEAREFMSNADWEYLYPAIRILPFELGLRFLEDHFAGDRYFKVPDRGQNLRRALTQFRLCEIIENKEGVIQNILKELGK